MNAGVEAPLRVAPWWVCALTVLGVIGVGACSPLPGSLPPPQLFTLTPKSTFPADLAKVDSQLLVEIPIAGESLNSDRIALQKNPLTLDYYANARWTERAPIMLQRLLVESFENTNRIVSVGRQAIDLRADYVLKTELREFQAIIAADGVPSAHVRLIARLVKMPERRIIAYKSVEVEITAQRREIEAVVEAFDEAVGKVLKKVAVWTLRTLSAQS